jgi:hypothetical protein
MPRGIVGRFCTTDEPDHDGLLIDMSTSPLDQALLASTLRAGGLEEGVRLLNERVPHRYTGIYQLTGNVLKCEVLYDKQHEVMPELLAVVPLEDSFCQFVLRDQGFQTSDARDDTRLSGHRYREVLLSYHGVPLLDASGALFGSLCHFDFLSLPLTDDEFENMKRASPLLSPFLPSGRG